MKKSLVAIVMVVSMLAMFVGPVAAAPLSAGTATLVSVVYVAGKGPVFTFEVSGEFSNEELNGALYVEGGDYFPLYCSQIDPVTVKCTVSKKAAGKNVTLSWAGLKFAALIPPAPEYCYNVYDWSLNASNTWVNYGSYCQDESANYGDFVEWFNPGWGGSFEYEFLPESPDALTCTFPIISEDAYYYPLCPSPFPV